MARSDEIPQLGRKRPADSDPDGAPLTKRFEYLQIGNTPGARPRDHHNGFNLNPSTTSTSTSTSTPLTVSALSASTASQVPISNSSPPCVTQSDAMMLDDTKHTTYIHDLDRELADIDTPDGGLIFLPLAAKLISVPESVLSTPSQGKELVLYTDPSSLTLPEEQDSVRKAIIESRARARARAQAASSHQSLPCFDHGPVSSSTQGFADTDTSLSYSTDDDPMDIDCNP
ncbi:hypothetical protein PEBR_21504 [Penicillium brasilianum]|uniref:Uncharacterized protein n=1 Tax=Penicillium brasilianum TaxID=104259 RepID=A0A1S9RLL9_PENBI|nr:hypothetical protein PEBR_21504 [Penicillium brasilianum]